MSLLGPARSICWRSMISTLLPYRAISATVVDSTEGAETNCRSSVRGLSSASSRGLNRQPSRAPLMVRRGARQSRAGKVSGVVIVGLLESVFGKHAGEGIGHGHATIPAHARPPQDCQTDVTGRSPGLRVWRHSPSHTLVQWPVECSTRLPLRGQHRTCPKRGAPVSRFTSCTAAGGT